VSDPSAARRRPYATPRTNAAPSGSRHPVIAFNGRLFTRLRADDRSFWFLGPATYRGHVGEKPMAITWELHHPLPGDLHAQFAAAA
jgi:hypothetical protein